MDSAAGPPRAYPVRVTASLDREPSRWLWLVKWILLIPHFIILFFLWIAFFVLTVIAFFAILFTARYPRGIFDFNVGVMRWHWRVHYYGYAALATDRYPPFRLAEDPDYPAHLDVAHPERLSRGLVLVKWWLLAIPHYLVLGVLLGGGWGSTWEYDERENGQGYGGSADPGMWDGGVWDGGVWDADRGGLGLITLLVLFAAIALLFTGRYPRGLYALVLGLVRWVIRVGAYAALMVDEYPPFRLDQGGEEPAISREEPAG